jgi:diguanylate cyclase
MKLYSVSNNAPDGPSAQRPTVLPFHAADTAGARGDVALADWDTMFVAVATKLRECVGTGLLSNAPLRHTSLEVQRQVLQCVAALDQLRTTMLHEVERAETHEAELSAALTLVKTELAHAHANEQTARHQAAHDGLTSLPNRDGFRARLTDVLAQGAAQGQVLALLYIDLDGFKVINDAHGHATGDHLLRIIGARLAGAVRSEDTVSRIGGDEFACLLWDAPPGREALSRLATSLFDVVSAPFQIGTLTLTVRPSIGIAMWPDDGSTVETLLDHADSAMYHAKRSKTGHAYFASSRAAPDAQ